MRPGAVSGLGLLIGMMLSLPASAGISDVFKPYAGLSYAYDDNLLRQGEQRARSDTARQFDVGFDYEQKISRQTLLARARTSKVDYRRFRQLDYRGKDFSGSWKWEVGNHLEGNLGASHVQVLAPYADLQTQERNLRVQKRQFADAAWRFHPSWRVRGGAARDEFSYELPIQRFNERSERATEAGIDYLASSGSTVGLQLRRLKASYPNPRSFGAVGFDDDYTQDEVKARIAWRYSGITQLSFLGGRVERKHGANPARRVTSGSNGRLVLDWAPLGKLRLSAAAWREFAAVESTLVSHSLNRGASLRANWQASAKLEATAQWQTQKRRFSGLSPLVPAGNLDDTVRSSNVALNYAPRRNVRIVVSAFRDARKGAAGLGLSDYRAKGATLGANILF